MQIFGLTIEGHGHDILAQSEQVKQDQTGLDSQTQSSQVGVSLKGVWTFWKLGGVPQKKSNAYIPLQRETTRVGASRWIRPPM